MIIIIMIGEKRFDKTSLEMIVTMITIMIDEKRFDKMSLEMIIIMIMIMIIVRKDLIKRAWK